MISFRSDNNAILLNESQLDSDITFYSDTGTTLVLDGGTTQAFFAVGSATAPTIAFSGDPDTGLHWVEDDKLSIDAGGVSRVQVSSTTTTINPDKIASGDFTVHGDTKDNLIFVDASTDSLSFSNGFTSGADIEVTDPTKGLILKSPDNSRWRVTIDNEGSLISTKLP
jgi:hypothetical protein